MFSWRNLIKNVSIFWRMMQSLNVTAAAMRLQKRSDKNRSNAWKRKDDNDDDVAASFTCSCSSSKSCSCKPVKILMRRWMKGSFTDLGAGCGASSGVRVDGGAGGDGGAEFSAGAGPEDGTIDGMGAGTRELGAGVGTSEAEGAGTAGCKKKRNAKTTTAASVKQGFSNNNCRE